MPRPKKDPSQRKDTDIRIPCTTAQKEQIQTAAEAAGKDVAAWARELLLANSEPKKSR